LGYKIIGGKMSKHITAVGALHIGFAIMGIVSGIIIFLILSSIGLFIEDIEAQSILSLIGSSIGIFLIVVSVPGLVAGIGLLYLKNWARILTLIISVLDLFNIPLGTLLGIYSIWVLVQEDTIKIFNNN